MPTYTTFCQKAGGNGTIHITSVVARNPDAAETKGRKECLDDWNAGKQRDTKYQLDDIFCLGVAAGNVQILAWYDQSDD